MIELLLWAVALYFGGSLAIGLLVFACQAAGFCMQWGKALADSQRRE